MARFLAISCGFASLGVAASVSHGQQTECFVPYHYTCNSPPNGPGNGAWCSQGMKWCSNCTRPAREGEEGRTGYYLPHPIQSFHFCLEFAASDVAVYFCDSVPEGWTTYCSVNGMCCAVRNGMHPTVEDLGYCANHHLDPWLCDG